MNDQATSLRRLKQLIDRSAPVITIKPEDFLTQIPRPCPFLSIAMIYPDQMSPDIPTVTDWIPGLMQYSPRACLWDQAGLINAEKIPKTQISLKYPTPIRFEAGLTPLTVLPKIQEFCDICKDNERIRIQMLQHLIRSLKNYSEVWISIKASELSRYFSIVHSTDAVCILIPQHPEAIIRSYETVKSIHLSGYFSPVGLLDIAPIKPGSDDRQSNRIKIVAKQFLALDLVHAGMVLSNCTYIPPDSEPNLRSRLSAIDHGSRDFLYCLSESLIYQIPGMF
ncbi:MAG: hypothetical protein Kow0029_02720 [Candidatus Rifleibacteriota bacterium]